MTTPVVYALHENPEWFGPFRAAFEAEGVPVVEWLLVDGVLDLDEVPPDGIFWSRISASSHTRGHGLTKEYTRSVLNWLEAHGRRTVNGRRVLELEVSKVDQLTALKAFGIDVPRTRAVIGSQHIVEAARTFPTPFITKHNQGGKGLSVHRFDSVAELDAWVNSDDFEEPQDGITLVQEYLAPAQPRITRVEIVDGELVYAITADTARGGYQLCPADACEVDATTGALITPPGATIKPGAGQKLFALREGFEHPVVEQYRAFTRAHGIEVAGIEFIETVDGRVVTYDVNTNTNYNADVEAVAPRSGPRQIARLLGRVLREEYPTAR
ncbi:RimK family alpha-L-glutamate ligase [Glaciihabitans sp. dw_435]|uniref:ATP-grasp domain-containing protein n=1 Tax=Glaciihabitans sp. dw_435 TaxID=2720081 RepID=UPI001BD62F99|nr:alpha-L-glutamate ligase [Glaciihabitans sp. dw_435]